MERVDKLISTFLRRRFKLKLSTVYSKLRSDLLQDMERVRCNLCDSDQSVEIAHKDKYDLAITTVMCRNCGLMYLNPRPTTRAYDRFYSEGGSKEGVYHMSLGLDNVEGILKRYYGPEFQMSELDAQDLENFVREKYTEHLGEKSGERPINELLQGLEAKAREFEAWRYDVYAEDIYRHFQDVVPRGGKVFEIGAAAGQLLLPWRDRHGCEVTGLEPRKATVEAAKVRSGIDLFQGFPSTADIPKNAYDAVLIIRTINHMIDPLSDLRHAWRWIKPGGVLIVDISDAFREAKYEGFENNVVEIDHTYMFSAATLKAMMQKAGYEFVRCDIVDTRHVWWGDRRELQFKQIRMVGRKSLQPVAIEWPDPLGELAELVKAQLAREESLLTRDTKPKERSSSCMVRRRRSRICR